ncbi:transmembrane channel-like protein 7 [Ruditapes philippinarum]|uniref:transmembrane channel-like protein 7 n=1 Tax=Ruditapes philippinarum TaxID=129788 RepID=UPI00295BFE9F|nr:transmembrane channel-like protein 7 [Ruditapes philippinarum]
MKKVFNKSVYFLVERRHDLEDEKKLEMNSMDGKCLKQRYQDLKEQDDLRASNFAELLRDSTLRKMRKLTEWKRPKRVEKFNRRMREFFSRFSLWVTSFKVIEGKFGTAVMSFFKFIRWLMFLNLFLMLVMVCVITIPYLALESKPFKETINATQSDYHRQAVNCSENYIEYSEELFRQESTFEKVLDFLQGTGWMERTVLFYGKYHNKTYIDAGGEPYTYNMGLAYILAIGACFLISFLLLIRNSAKTVKTTFGMETSVAAYTNRVYAGWDYAITNKKAAKVKSANLYTEFKSCLDEEIQKKRRENRSPNDQATIFFIRVLVNCFVLALLGGSLFLVYFTTDRLLVLQEQELNEVLALIVQYLPYLTITVLNFLIPIVFQKIVTLEDYSQNNALRITLGRSILLRLASLAVLIGSLYRLLIINADPADGFCGNRLWEKTVTTARGSIKCWETYVGQQIYKLVLLDLVVETSIIVFVQLPRRLIYDRYGNTVGIVKKLGPQEFDLPQNVIDIIYSQTLCWLGMFFSPLVPLMTFLKCFIFFYLRKWTLLKNCADTELTYRTSRSHSLFMFVLLVSFILATVPVGYMISSIAPSQSCGPFRVYSSPNYTMFDSLSNTVKSWPETLRDILLFLSSVAFLVPAIIILCLLMYYFWLLGSGYKRREEILSEQLKMVSKDKQFLLARVNEVLMHAET